MRNWPVRIFRLSSVRKIIPRGKRFHQKSVMTRVSFRLRSIDPHDSPESPNPTFRNDKTSSPNKKIGAATASCDSTNGSREGNIWRRKIWMRVPPSDRAASTYEEFFNCRIRPRVPRAIGGHVTAAMVPTMINRVCQNGISGGNKARIANKR